MGTEPSKFSNNLLISNFFTGFLKFKYILCSNFKV